MQIFIRSLTSALGSAEAKTLDFSEGLNTVSPGSKEACDAALADIRALLGAASAESCGSSASLVLSTDGAEQTVDVAAAMLLQEKLGAAELAAMFPCPDAAAPSQPEMLEAERLWDDIQRLDAQCSFAAARRSELERSVADSRKHQRRLSLEKLSIGRAAAKDCEAKHAAALARLNEAQAAVRDAEFTGAEADAAALEADIEGIRVSRARISGKEAVSPVPSAVAAVLSLAAAVFAAVLRSPAVAVCAVIIAAAAAYLFSRYSAARKDIARLQADISAVLKKYSAADEAQLRAQLEEYRRLNDALRDAERDEAKTRAALAQSRALISALESDAVSELNFSSGSSEAVVFSQELNGTRAELAGLEAERAAAAAALAGLHPKEQAAAVFAAYLSFLADRHCPDTVSPAHEPGAESVLSIKQLCRSLAENEAAVPAGASVPLILAPLPAPCNAAAAAAVEQLLSAIAHHRQVIRFLA